MLDTIEKHPALHIFNGQFTGFIAIFVGCVIFAEMGRFFKISGKVLLWTTGTVLGLMIILEIVLSGTVLTRIVEKVATEYVDGQIHFGNV